MKPFDKLLLGLGFLTSLILAIIFLPKLNSDLASSLGSGAMTFFNGLWIAVQIVFVIIVALGIAFAVVKIRKMAKTQVIQDGKDGQIIRAVIHDNQLIPLANNGQDLVEMMKLQQQQVVQMQTYWKMLNTATASMKNMAAYLEQLEVVDADEYEEDEEDEQIETTQPMQIAPPQSTTGGYEEMLANILEEFQIHAQVLPEVTKVGPRVIQLGVVPTGVPGRRTRIDEITKREKDIQLALRTKSIRIISPVPGTRYVGIEIPNPAPTTVTIGDVLESSEYQDAYATSKLVFALGRDITGKVQICDIEKAPHLLIGGATNQGKSVLLNVLIACLLNQATPEEVRLLMIDPKQVELTPYNGIPHLLRPVITDMSKVVPMLKHAIDEMERRYRIFAGLGVRKLSEYREARLQQPELENLPAWVIIFDEFADLMMTAPSETEEKVIRFAQKGRAAGIHLVIATQKPVVKVVTGLIKSNLPTSIALKTKTEVDSRVILDEGGAERLLGNGDMLYSSPDTEELIRIQGAYITGEEIQSLIASWKTGDEQNLTVSVDEVIGDFIGNAETGVSASGNGLETASQVPSKIIDGVFPDTTKVTEELTENLPSSTVSKEIRETIKRLVAMKKRPAHRDIAKAVGLGGRNYPIYRQVCKEEGIVIAQQDAEEA